MNLIEKTVLIADSDQLDNMRLSILLKRLDYYVLSVLNGANAIKAITGFKPDIILLNLRLLDVNGMDGTTCLANIQKDASLKTIPVVVMGEKSDAKVLEECLKNGAATYIVKPINPTPLYCAIQKLTEKKPRENLRVRIIFKTTILYQNFKRVSFASNLSEAGVFIRSLQPIPVGTKVSLSMDLPSKNPIELEGVVVNIIAFNKERFIEPGICIQFVNIDKNIQLGLRKFVEEQLTYDLDPNLEL